MLLQRLKLETRDLHDRIEMDLSLLRDGVSLDQYRNTLIQFYGFYTPWEHTVLQSSNPNIRCFLEDRQKSPLLRADLLSLGLSEKQIFSLPACTDLPCLNREERIIGSWYVIEGATLGGQVISRKLQQDFQSRGGVPHSFFRSYGDQLGLRWRAFCQFAESFSDESRDDQIVDAARETFAKMHAWLCPRKHPPA